MEKRVQKIQSIIEEIRNCKNSFDKSKSPCYVKDYDKTDSEYSKLKNSPPLVDDWRNQKVLLISQAPSKPYMSR